MQQRHFVSRSALTSLSDFTSKFLAKAPALLTMVATLLLVAASSAQELGSGVIRGEVSDPQSALVHGAEVVAIQTTTGLQRSTTTTDSGLFVVNDLAPGDYQVKVVATGFGEYETPVHLEVGQQVNLRV